MSLFRNIIVLLLLCIAPLVSNAQKLHIAVAANAQFATQALIAAFRAKTGFDAELMVSSSGKLTAQISQGAPIDVFLSADMHYPETLFKKGLTVDSPRVYAYGTLVLWTLKDIPVTSMMTLLSKNISQIAVANPQTAPYGVATIEVLKKLDIYQKVKSKIVYGESIAQVNHYLLSGAVDVAFTAKSIVSAPALRDKGKWVAAPTGSYQPIAQGVVLLKFAQQNHFDRAQAFYRFLFSPEAKTILTKYGYQTAN